MRLLTVIALMRLNLEKRRLITRQRPPVVSPAQAHPLCEKEVKTLVSCHENNKFMKFLNACGDAKVELDRCFREEKKLRVKLNKRIPNPWDDDVSAPAASAKAAP